MAYHSVSARVKAVLSFDAVLASSTQNGAGVDTLGYRRAEAVISIWTGASTTANFQLQDSPDNSTWTTVTGGTLASAIVASTADAGPYLIDIDLAKRQRYLRINAIGTGTAGNVCANIFLYEPENAAVTQTNTVLSV